MLRGAPWWPLDAIEADVERARQEFRRRRLGEPLQRYLNAFDLAEPEVERLVSHLESLVAGGSAAEADLRALCVAEAQDTPMAVFWSHRLDDLKAFVEAAR